MVRLLCYDLIPQPLNDSGIYGTFYVDTNPLHGWVYAYIGYVPAKLNK